MKRINRLRQWLRAETGQMLIVFAMLIVPVTFAVGAVAVDASLWQSERRGAQKDADLAALAGAWELLDQFTAFSDLETNARTAAGAYADENDEAGNASIIGGQVTVDSACFGGGSRPDRVEANIDHDSRTLFAEFFGLDVAPEVGGHAVACAGSDIGGTGRVPIQIDSQGPCFEDGEPQYTELCPLEYGAQDPNSRGVINLLSSGDNCSANQGSGDLYDLILNGSGAYCLVSEDRSCEPPRNGPWVDCVVVQGGTPKKIVDGFSDRVAREGSCDDDGSGVEEFDETVNLVFDSGDPTTSIYEARTCPNGKPSPRIITIFVVEEKPPTNSGNKGIPTIGFASFYVKGCHFGNQPVDPATMDLECAASNQFGHVVVHGNFVKLVTTNGEIGEFNPLSTGVGITLVE